jgi:peptidoglycan biosynthesis protein MviN/MurJ (putative lipid II flippase)
MKGLLVGMVLNAWFSYFVNIWLVSKHIGYRWQRQLLDTLPVLLASVVAAAAAFAVGWFWPMSLYVDGAVKLVIFLALYVAWSLLFHPVAYQYFCTVLKPMMKKIKKRKNKNKKAAIKE